jgi:hypothetical protein
MFPDRKGLSAITSALLIACAASSSIPGKALAAAYGVNLLVNGNAEAGAASPTGTPVPVPEWTVSSAFTVVPYGAAGGFPTVSQGPPDGMNQFFAGGNADTSTATQDIDISDNAADIDAGIVVCDFSAWLGGMADQEDNAMMTVIFNAANMTPIASSAIGPVMAADRSSQTKLLLRGGSIGVPQNTRSIRVSLAMQRLAAETFNDGYADSLSVILRGQTIVTTTADSGPGSLREAITNGNAVITFDPQVFGEPHGPQTITLQSALPSLGGTQSIIGPGANLLAVSRSSDTGAAKFQIFSIGSPEGLFLSSVSIRGLTMANGDVSNTASGAGGAISVSYGNLVLEGCVLTGSKADDYGALWAVNASVVLDGCTISNNSASRVGAIGNEAKYGGTSTMTITNCTISGNTTSDPDSAMGPEVLRNQSDAADATAMMNLDSTTINGNTGGFRQVTSGDDSKAIISLQNNIIASTGANFTVNAGGTYVSQGYNLSNRSDSAVLNQTGDRNNTNPMLDQLQDNGGSTPTHALLPGSPAIDKGYTSLMVDQRGFPRPINDPASPNGGGNDTDIGAYEFGSSPKALRNISTRLQVESGDNVLIAGFIVSGTQPKKVIIRGIGPSLPLTGHLGDPTLELRDSSGAILDSNDDWVNSPDKQAIIDSAIPPTNDLESAIVATLPANGSSYTAVVRGKDGGTGIGVVEVYDLDAAADSKLANISTRGFVSTGDNVMVAGTITVGLAPQKVIIRAIGPSLSVPGKLADPTLELRDANGELIDANDNWGDSPNKQAILDSTIPPKDQLESAIVATLPAGISNYTAIVRGAGNGSSGVPTSEAASTSISRTQFGSGNTLEIQRVQFARSPIGGSFQLIVRRPTSIVSGQPGDRAALEDSITVAWNATADEIKAAIMASSKFYKYDQNNNLTAGPAGFHTLFDSGGGSGITGNEGFRREPVITGSVTDFTIQFGTLTTGIVGTRNTWIRGLPLVQIDDSSIVYDNFGIAVVEIYALH